MNGILLAIMVAGAIAVLAFIGYLVVGATRGWRQRPALLLLRSAAALGIVCGILGVVLAFTSP